MMKWVLACLIGAIIIGALLVSQRHAAFVWLATSEGGNPPPLLEPSEELSTTVWHDDYFTVDLIAPDTYAIGEPRYAQQNFNYLIVGDHTALLFDAGPGLRDIRRVVRRITDLPLIFLPSHFHYDHVGNGIDFARRAVVDLPYLRERAVGNQLTFTNMEHLGPIEGFDIPTWTIDHWWPPGTLIDLGGRELSLIHTPGHSKESISLMDRKNGIVLSGDYLYQGPLYAFVPGASLQDYLDTAEALLNETGAETTWYGAHRSNPPGPPGLEQSDLEDLQRTLRQVRSGSAEGQGLWPTSYQVNERITLLAEPPALQDWR